MSIHPTKLRRARALLEDGFGWTTIARCLRVHHDTIRRALDPEWRARKNAEIRKSGDRLYGRNQITRLKYVEPPAKSLEERNYAYESPMSLTAFLCGDPPRGRSALDKKLEQAQWQSR